MEFLRILMPSSLPTRMGINLVESATGHRLIGAPDHAKDRLTSSPTSH